jgi:hypothetical protein
MPQQQQTEFKLGYVPPIICKCGGYAHLIRRAPHPLKLDGVTEIQTFQCYKCRQVTETTIET